MTTTVIALSEYDPDAVSLDIHLPDIDGWRVLERLKKDPATRHVPVCVISTDDAKDRALGSGCLAFLAKPIASRDLLDGLLDHVGDYLNRPARQLVPPEQPQPEERGLQEEGAQALHGQRRPKMLPTSRE